MHKKNINENNLDNDDIDDYDLLDVIDRAELFKSKTHKESNESNYNNSINESPYIPPQSEKMKGRKTLVLDLDETLIHSRLKENEKPNNSKKILIRPGLNEFLKKVSELYEVVIYTASLKKYADSIIDAIDPNKLISYRLYRDHCNLEEGVYTKNLGRLGRDLKNVIILDNLYTSYSRFPYNGITVETWTNDKHDTELRDIMPVLELLTKVDDIRKVFKKVGYQGVMNYEEAAADIEEKFLYKEDIIDDESKPSSSEGDSISLDLEIGSVNDSIDNDDIQRNESILLSEYSNILKHPTKSLSANLFTTVNKIYAKTIEKTN